MSSSTRSGDGPDDRETVTWATETLPLELRKELLERELKKLGLRKPAAQGGGTPQHHPHGENSHPQADEDADGARHGD